MQNLWSILNHKNIRLNIKVHKIAFKCISPISGSVDRWEKHGRIPQLCTQLWNSEIAVDDSDFVEKVSFSEAQQMLHRGISTCGAHFIRKSDPELPASSQYYITESGEFQYFFDGKNIFYADNG